jgi:predicted nucleic acid-binding protein
MNDFSSGLPGAGSTRPLVDMPIWSDNLSTLREIISAFPVLAANLGVPESVRLVLDANVLLSEVRWLVKKRKDPSARTALQEALASGTLVGFAPTYLEEEMYRQLAALAQEEQLSHDALQETWAQYKVALIFYDAGGPSSSSDGSHVDPKDVPYVEAYSALGAAAIMTADPHLLRMGARTVDAELSIRMRSYARDASVDFTLRVGGLVLGTAAIAGVIGLAKIGVALIGIISRLPPSLRLVAWVCLIGALVYRPNRQRLLRAATNASTTFSTFLDDAWPVIGELVAEAMEKRERAATAWSEIEPRISGRHVTLAAHTLAVCSASKSSLTVDEITQKLRMAGARTSAPTFPRYLRRVLGNHPRLAQTANGAWTVAPRTSIGLARNSMLPSVC